MRLILSLGSKYELNLGLGPKYEPNYVQIASYSLPSESWGMRRAERLSPQGPIGPILRSAFHALISVMEGPEPSFDDFQYPLRRWSHLVVQW